MVSSISPIFLAALDVGGVVRQVFFHSLYRSVCSRRPGLGLACEQGVIVRVAVVDKVAAGGRDEPAQHGRAVMLEASTPTTVDWNWRLE